MRRRLGDRERTVALAVVLVLAAPGWASVSIAQDWPSWRGPADDGMARDDAPVAWDENQDVKWKVVQAVVNFHQSCGATADLRHDRHSDLTSADEVGWQEAVTPR